MKYKKFLFLLFIFLASSFLFFDVDFAKAENGACFCTITNSDGSKTTMESSATEETCAADSKENYKCEWSSGAVEDICSCNILDTTTDEVSYGEEVNATEVECSDLVGETVGNQVYESCLWKKKTGTETTGGSSAEPPIDLPSVEGLKQLNISGSDTKTVVRNLFGNIISVAMGLLGSIALALFAYAGVLWMLAGGNAERSTQAKNIVVWAVLGLFVIFASYTIVSFIFSAVE